MSVWGPSTHQDSLGLASLSGHMALSLTGDHVFAVNHEYSPLLCLQNTRVSLSWRVTRVWMDGCLGLDGAIQVRETSGSWGGSQDLLCEAGGKTWTLKRLLWEGTSWGLQEEGGSHGMWLLKAMTHRK